MLASRAAELGTDLLTLCTGTRNPDNMWADHPQNTSPEAWSDLLAAMEQALALAESTMSVSASSPKSPMW